MNPALDLDPLPNPFEPEPEGIKQSNGYDISAAEMVGGISDVRDALDALDTDGGAHPIPFQNLLPPALIESYARTLKEKDEEIARLIKTIHHKDDQLFALRAQLDELVRREIRRATPAPQPPQFGTPPTPPGAQNQGRVQHQYRILGAKEARAEYGDCLAIGDILVRPEGAYRIVREDVSKDGYWVLEKLPEATVQAPPGAGPLQSTQNMQARQEPPYTGYFGDYNQSTSLGAVLSVAGAKNALQN